MSITAHDVAAYILDNQGEMTAMKLQRLVYYCQAWSLVWDDQPLFSEVVQAWASGPICPDLYDVHQNLFRVSQWGWGQGSNLDVQQRETVDAILHYYGDKHTMWLSKLARMEMPWIWARHGLTIRDQKGPEISHESMRDYYKSIYVPQLELTPC